MVCNKFNIRFFIFKKGQWMGLLAILLISISFFGLARAIATFILRIKIRQKSLDLNVEEQYESTMPFGCLLFSLTWLVGVRQLEFDLEVLQIFTRGAYIATAFSAVWSTLKIVDYISLHFKKLLGSKFALQSIRINNNNYRLECIISYDIYVLVGKILSISNHYKS